MAHINLLPWRAEQRRQQTQEFIKRLVLVIILSCVITFAGYTQVNEMLNYQNSRLEYIEKEIALLQKDLDEIQELEDYKKELLSRMRIVQDLQGDRPRIVHIFYEVSHTVPSGVYLRKITQTKKGLKIEGEAQSNAQVSDYMKNLGGSPVFDSPKLSSINTDPASRNSKFVLSVDTNPDEETKE